MFTDLFDAFGWRCSETRCRVSNILLLFDRAEAVKCRDQGDGGRRDAVPSPDCGWRKRSATGVGGAWCVAEALIYCLSIIACTA